MLGGHISQTTEIFATGHCLYRTTYQHKGFDIQATIDVPTEKVTLNNAHNGERVLEKTSDYRNVQHIGRALSGGPENRKHREI